MNKLLWLVAVLCSAQYVCALTSGPFTASIGATTTELNNVLTVTAFDTNLGTLTGLTASIQSDVITDLTITNEAGTASSGTAFTQVFFRVVDSNGNSPFTTSFTSSAPVVYQATLTTDTQSYSLSAGASTTLTPDEIDDDAGGNGALKQATLTGASNSATQHAFFLDVQVPGGGSFPITVSTLTVANIGNTGGNTVAAQSTTASAIFTITYTYTAATTGDPQIVGFQGQRFQIHGTPDEYFNLISSANYYVNSRFVYMATGSCTYNETECFSHPGTYIGVIGFMADNYQVRVASGPHATGLSVFINDKLAVVGSRLTINNSTSVHVISHNRVAFTTADFSLTAVNSDAFLNLGVDFTNARVLHAGHVKVTVPGSASPADADKLISKTYPEFAMHGLLGQTWRNIVWPSARLYQGEPTDYQVSSLFSPEFVYTQFQA